MVSSELKQLAASVNSNVDTMHHEVFLDHDDETKCLTQNGLPTDCPLFNCFVVFVLFVFFFILLGDRLIKRGVKSVSNQASRVKPP